MASKGCFRVLIWIVIATLIVLLIAPLIVPIPPPAGTVPPRALADADSRFITLNSLEVHYRMAGQGEPVFLLLHGFGASTFSWREVIAPLAEIGTVVAFDRPAFGLTERPLPEHWGEANPYTLDAQVQLTIALLDALGIEQAVLVGNSAGGTIAAWTALRYPERVKALVFVNAAIYEGGGTPNWVRPLLRTPHLRRIGPLLVRALLPRLRNAIDLAWHDPSRITAEIRQGYEQPLRAEHWDRALWEFTLASRRQDLAAQLDQIAAPALVIAGRSDRIVPVAQSMRLAEELPHAELVVIPDCGHVPQEECPEEFMRALTAFVTQKLQRIQ